MSIRFDYLPNHPELKIYQDSEMFCINTDTMVLGEFLEIRSKDVALDIGTNTGALLIYASAFKPKKMVGIDLNERALELAKKNMEINQIKNVKLIRADGNIFRMDEEADVVIFNPPYFKTLVSDKGQNPYLALAKHEDNFPLSSMIDCINRNLRVGGRLYFLFQTSRLMEVIRELDRKKLIVKKMKFVYDENKMNSTVVLIKAVKGANQGVNVEKPVVISRNDKTKMD